MFEVSCTIPMVLRAAIVSFTISLPKSCASPPVGTVMPVRIRMVVVLPAPLRPEEPEGFTFFY